MSFQKDEPLSLSSSTRALGLLALELILGSAACYLASPVLIPIIASLFLFILLDPMVDWSARKKISRKLSAPLLIVSFMAATVLIGWATYGAFSKLANDIPQYSGKVRKVLTSFEMRASRMQEGTNTLLPQVSKKDDVQKVEIVENFGGGWTGFLLRGLGTFFSTATSCFLVPILALFLLLEKPHLRTRLKRAVEPYFALDPVEKEMSQMVKSFFFGNLVVGAGSAAGFFLLFSILGLDNKVALALSSGFISLVPLLGAILSAIFPLAQSVLQFDTAGPILIILIFSILLHFILANLIIPRIIGSRINVNATAATIGLIFWGWLWGAVGLLLAVPLTAVVRIFLATRATTRPWSDLLAEDTSGPVTRIWLPRKSM